MPRAFLAALLLVGVAGSEDSSGPRPPGPHAVVEAGPDTSRARPLGRWPTAADLANLRSVEGRPTAFVLEVLGHPSRVERRPGGGEVWEYPWCAACRVWVRHGLCESTFYTAGY